MSWHLKINQEVLLAYFLRYIISNHNTSQRPTWNQENVDLNYFIFSYVHDNMIYNILKTSIEFGTDIHYEIKFGKYHCSRLAEISIIQNIISFYYWTTNFNKKIKKPSKMVGVAGNEGYVLAPWV